MKTDDLDKLTDAELSERVAVELQEWAPFATFYEWHDRKGRKHPRRFSAGNGNRELGEFSAYINEAGEKFYCGEPQRLIVCPPYATSADAVLPLAPVGLRIKRTATGWATDLATEHVILIGDDVVLARAVCKTLLRAKRAEKGGAQ